MQLNPRPIVPNRSSRTIALLCALAALTAGCVSGGQSGDLNGNALSEPDARATESPEPEVDAGSEASESATEQTRDPSSSDGGAVDTTSGESSAEEAATECDELCRQALFAQLCQKKSVLPCAGRDLEACLNEAADDFAQASAVSDECVAGYLRATRCYGAGEWRCDELGREAGDETCSPVEQAALANCESAAR